MRQSGLSVIVCSVVVMLSHPAPASSQDFGYRGFAEIQSALYPQHRNTRDDRLVVEGRFRLEQVLRPVEWLTFTGSIDARLDNIEQVERSWRVSVRDRSTGRPALALRTAAATFRRGTLAVDVGRQFIRWGKADILNPTDRFAPRDFLEVTDDEVLGVTGVRLQYERGMYTFDAAWVPIFTPSRIPLLDGRWAVRPELPPMAPEAPLVDLGAEFPDRPQIGARWNVVGAGFDVSVSYFNGSNHLPEFAVITGIPGLPDPTDDESMVLALRRSYAGVRMLGADAAVPLRWFTLKGEIASLLTSSAQSDDVVLYVVQIERQSGELSLVGGYAGEIVTERRSPFEFAPDRGLTRAFLGRAGYTISATRDVSFEAAVRQNLDGVLLKGQYSAALGTHWRATVAGAAIAGHRDDFIGQYQRNSHLLLTLRYSF